ncbi:MAG: RHS repeat-associated core domain-containing protein [Pyrinomonadaceae bacterium]
MSIKPRFTSYDRSAKTGLDYAINRTYDSKQGRFTQVDPIGMESVVAKDPQTLNLYAYCANDPINHTDPNGLGFFSFLKKLFKGIGKLFSAVGNVIAKILNNRWVRLGVFILGFLVPFLAPAIGAVIKAALDIYNFVADIATSLQISGMLFQGKFKELGVTLAIGVVSAAISAIADSVIQGVKDSLTKNGKFSFKNFTWKGFFSGAIKGLKKGLSSVFGRGWESLIPIYGRYCAPGYGNGGNGANGIPIDGLDSLCDRHDGVYNGTGGLPNNFKNAFRLEADQVFFRGLFRAVTNIGFGDIIFSGRPSGGNVFRSIAIPAFGGMIVYRGTR